MRDRLKGFEATITVEVIESNVHVRCDARADGRGAIATVVLPLLEWDRGDDADRRNVLCAALRGAVSGTHELTRRV